MEIMDRIQLPFNHRPVSFRQQEDIITVTDVLDEPEAYEEELSSEGQIVCKNCYNILTKSTNKISVNGSHRHVFANPHGLVFEIGCFADVSGCAHAGVPTREFSWFSGYKWRVAVCSSCIAHLGWGFSGGDIQGFHGLILDNIAETGTSPSKGLY